MLWLTSNEAKNSSGIFFLPFCHSQVSILVWANFKAICIPFDSVFSLLSHCSAQPISESVCWVSVI